MFVSDLWLSLLVIIAPAVVVAGDLNALQRNVLVNVWQSLGTPMTEERLRFRLNRPLRSLGAV